MNAIMSKEDAKQKDEEKRQKRETKRAAQRAQNRKEVDGMDVLAMTRQEMGAMDAGFGGQDVMQQRDDEEKEEENQEQQQDEGGIIGCISWLIRAPRAPPKLWETYRKEEIRAFIEDQKASIVGAVGTETLFYHQIKNRRVNYIGDRNRKDKREGRGICIWPDPPEGGGESYFGLWRDDQPNGHGVFRWFTGDLYMGQWSVGKQQGYGVYSYAPGGPYAGDSYEGTYYNALRQGSGVYRYAASQGHVGGIYIGEWMKGKCSGFGALSYMDGESYLGCWLNDQKEGLGVYTWGSLSGEVAGDKFEGRFKKGLAEGYGRTAFNDGGWHKGIYREGKMNGYGIMLTSDGWEYMGTWVDDELHGRFVCEYSFGFGSQKTVQIYEHGEFVMTTEYDPARDWCELEALALEAASAGDSAGDEAKENVVATTKIAKRAKESQLLAQDSAEEARYMLRAAVNYKKYLKQFFGIRKYVWPTDA